jgi:hypothetical protein
MNEKPIDINQRIPLEILHAVLESYLTGSYSEGYILEQLRLHIKGENRLEKSLRIVKKVVYNNPLSGFLMENKDQIIQAIKKKDDRNLILVALLNTAFTFSFNIALILGRLFKVQDEVSREALTRQLSRIYGGNRSLTNAVDSIIPMFLEAGLFTRPSTGLYKWVGGLQVSSPVTNQIFVESYRINNSLDKVPEYQLNDPYFLFLV